MFSSRSKFNPAVFRVFATIYSSTCNAQAHTLIHARFIGKVNPSKFYSHSPLSETPDLGCTRLSCSRLLHTKLTCRQKMKQRDDSGKRSTQITESKDTSFSELSLGQKVQQAGKDATYTGIIILGVGITGMLFYAVGRELFSGQSPSGVYSRAVKLCTNSDKVKDSLGEPMKAYGEMSSRGRRKHVRSSEYEVNGVKHMKVQFYLEGPSNKGTVQAEVKQDNHGKYQFECVLMELDSYPRRVIVIEDHR